MVQIYSASDPPDAHIVHDMLVANGIGAVIQGEDLWIARGMLPITPGTAPSLWVNEADADRARALIAAHRHQNPPA
jgi:hypothetical protein